MAELHQFWYAAVSLLKHVEDASKFDQANLQSSMKAWVLKQMASLQSYVPIVDDMWYCEYGKVYRLGLRDLLHNLACAFDTFHKRGFCRSDRA